MLLILEGSPIKCFNHGKLGHYCYDEYAHLATNIQRVDLDILIMSTPALRRNKIVRN